MSYFLLRTTYILLLRFCLAEGNLPFSGTVLSFFVRISLLGGSFALFNVIAGCEAAGLGCLDQVCT